MKLRTSNFQFNGHQTATFFQKWHGNKADIYVNETMKSNRSKSNSKMLVNRNGIAEIQERQPFPLLR